MVCPVPEKDALGTILLLGSMIRTPIASTALYQMELLAADILRNETQEMSALIKC